MHLPPAIMYVHTPRGDIAYQTVGSGSLNLLLLSPLSRAIETFWDYPPNASLYGRLARFCRIILFDRRGLGLSDPLPTNIAPTWEDWLDDILAVLDHLGVTQTALLAERDAGAAALMFAASHPQRVRALVVGNTSARGRAGPDYPFGESEERVEQFSRIWEESWGTERIVALTRPTHAGDPDYVRWVTRMQRTACSPRRAAAEFRYVVNFDVRAVLPTIQAPTLVLHRRDFTLLSWEHGRHLAEHIPGARLEVLSGSDIDVLLHDDEATLALVEEFLTGTRSLNADERLLATVLFTDIAQSTRLAAQLGDSKWREALQKHHDIVRIQLQRFRGREIDTAGDGFFASFDGPARALRCAQAVQTELRHKMQLEVRVGVHVGECERLGDKLSGIAVHIGSRIMHAAQPGEVLASSTVKDLVIGSGLTFREAGLHELKDVPGKWPLFALQN